MSPLDRHINKLINYVMMNVISAQINLHDNISELSYKAYQIYHSFYECQLGLLLMDYCI